MIRDITLGQYYQTDSVIHRLDPRVKLVATFVYIISLFLFHNFTGYLVAALFLAMVIKLSHVPFRYMVKGMKATEVVKRLQGIRCGNKLTSCPDQLAHAITLALKQ